MTFETFCTGLGYLICGVGGGGILALLVILVGETWFRIGNNAKKLYEWNEAWRREEARKRQEMKFGKPTQYTTAPDDGFNIEEFEYWM